MALITFVLFGFLCARVAGHGFMASPAQRGTVNPHKANSQSVILRETADGRIAAFYFQSDNCTNDAGSLIIQVWPQNECIAERPGFHDGFIVTTAEVSHKLRPGSILDCTDRNECHNPIGLNNLIVILGQGSYNSSAPTTAFVKSTNTSVYITWSSTGCGGSSGKYYDQDIYLNSMKLRLDTCNKLLIHESTRDCPGEACMWYSEGCAIGCSECTGILGSPCKDTIEPTINDPALRTFDVNNDLPGQHGNDLTKSNPWRAPGTAPVLDACGMAGGANHSNSAAAGIAPAGFLPGDVGSALPEIRSPRSLVAGSKVEVVWRLAVNHGGGYQYRLCPKSEGLTEECFQRTPLLFDGNTQRLIFPNGTVTEIPATYVSHGTTPSSSMWARVPIPACYDITGGFGNRGCEKPMFAPPPGCDETCWGYMNIGNRTMPDIADTLILPRDLQPGNYVLGLRWDIEQGSQVWNGCADVVVKAVDVQKSRSASKLRR